MQGNVTSANVHKPDKGKASLSSSIGFNYTKIHEILKFAEIWNTRDAKISFSLLFCLFPSEKVSPDGFEESVLS